MRPADFSDQAKAHLTPIRAPERAVQGRPGLDGSVESWAFVPPLLPPPLDARRLRDALYEPIVEAERALSALEGAASHLENPYILINPLMRREAILSSRIENTFASAQQLALFEASPADAARTAEEINDIREVSNYVRALEAGMEDHRPICLNLIRDLHRILLCDVRGQDRMPGEFRAIPVAIGDDRLPFAEATFVPCPSGDPMMQRLHNLESFLHANDRIPRLARFAIAHYQFEAIHPFRDGNGRVGRLLIALQLCSHAQLSKPLVHVSGFFEPERDAYYRRLLRVSTHGEWLPWIEFFLQAVETQAKDASNRVQNLASIQAKYHALVREKRASAVLPELVDQLFVDPWLTVARVASFAHVTPAAAGRLVDRLVSKQIVVEATGRARNRIFVAPEILNVIYA